MQHFEENGDGDITPQDRIIDLYHFASLAHAYFDDPAIESAATEVMAAINSYIRWKGDCAAGGLHDYCYGVSAFFAPEKKECYYSDGLLDFASGATWACTGTSASALETAPPAPPKSVTEAFEWGAMLVDYINDAVPDAVENWTLPELVEIYQVRPTVYLPLVLKNRRPSSSPLTPPTPIPNESPNVPANPLPADGATDQNAGVDLAWTGGDPDGDTVTYDVHLEAGDSTPDWLMCKGVGSSFCALATLNDDTHYYWQVIARDEHGATTTGPVWDFTTAPPTDCCVYLELNPPQVDGLTVTVDGTATSDCSTITRINWQWGDGTSDDQFFPAWHAYVAPGTYGITATAYSDLGGPCGTAMATTSVSLTPGPQPGPMVFVPAGQFQMGCEPTVEGYCADTEVPLHTVTLNSYCIDTFEVTNFDYGQCVAAGVCSPPSDDSSASYPFYYDDPTFAGYPVIHVSWHQAANYCTWAGKRLPTEAEWEKAARGNLGPWLYPWGDSAPACWVANFFDGGYCVGDTSQVGSYPYGMSYYGALDMSGNVWEWVNDWYQSDYYSTSPDTNPTGPADGTYKGVRGGSWADDSYYIRAAYRGFAPPDGEAYTIGFRCAMACGE